MQIRLDTIHEIPKSFEFKETPSSFPVLAEMECNGEIEFCGDLTASVTIFKEFDHFTLNGKASLVVTLECSRCLERFKESITPSFKVIYRKQESESSECEDEIELTEADLVSSYYNSDEIDISHEIETQLVMDIPVKPLCSNDCRGLCPECGISLSKEQCSCSGINKFSPFSVLEKLKIK